MSKAQAFSRYLDSDVGRELYWASKCKPGAAEYLAKAAPDADPFEGGRKRDNEVRGPAHAEMHSLAIDSQRERGGSYEMAYARVYGHPDNRALRDKVRDEHLASMTLSMGGAQRPRPRRAEFFNHTSR